MSNDAAPEDIPSGSHRGLSLLPTSPSTGTAIHLARGQLSGRNMGDAAVRQHATGTGSIYVSEITKNVIGLLDPDSASQS